MNYVHAPQPRPLTQTESLDSLNHWKNIFRNYYRRDSSFKQFLKPGCKWDYTRDNYALQGSEEETAEEKADSLNDFLNNLAGFLPHSYLTQKILEETTCLQDCWNVIYEHYNVQVTPETLLDFESLSKEESENYRQFYERLVQHVRLHLAPVGAKVESVTNTVTDSMSISLLNMIALQWLRKCHPQLITAVRKEYAIQLRKGEQLAALVPQIAPNVESMINKYCSDIKFKTNQINLEPAEKLDSKVAFVKRDGRFQNQTKNKGSFKNKNGHNQEYLFCPGCFAVSKEMKIAIDFKHRPTMCPRTQAVTRFLQGDVATYENVDDEENYSNSSDSNGMFKENKNNDNEIKLQSEITEQECVWRITGND